MNLSVDRPAALIQNKTSMSDYPIAVNQ